MVLSKESLLFSVWGAYSEVEPATLTVHIRWLREKLEDDPSNPRFIKTAHRIGYILEADI
jgi:two-component system response regulator VicR